MRSFLLLFLVLFSTSYYASAQNRNISGVVTDTKGETLPGVSVKVKGTTLGTSTDVDGKYSLSAPANATLVIAYIGYETKEVAVNNQAQINVTLGSSSTSLNEVVVTALGIEREKKSLTYTVQTVDTESISKAREFNVVNSLAGKVAGLNFQTSTQGVGGASRIILRGNRSISGSSEPLYIVDGVPGSFTNINPDDVESITVLKGPNAAALYGSTASNGAVVITTKKGADGFKVSFNQSYTADLPNILIDYQDEYGQGTNGIYAKQSARNWGPKMDGRMVDHWSNDPNWAGPKQYAFLPQPDNVKDFFQTGKLSASNLAISTGNEKHQTYFSYTFTEGNGVVRNNDINQHNANLRLNNKLGDKLTLDSKLSYIKKNVLNPIPAFINYENQMWNGYQILRNLRTEDIRQYEFTDPATGYPVRHYWNVSDLDPGNAYGIVEKIKNNTFEDQVSAFSTLRYEFTKNLSAHLRSSLIRSFGSSEKTLQGGLVNLLPVTGSYSVGASNSTRWDNDVLVSYKGKFKKNFEYNANVGGSTRLNRNSSSSSSTGVGLTVPNFYALSNTQQVVSSYSVGSPREMSSVYGFGQIGYKGLLYLDVTGRNDWSSTLPRDNWSYFYPSVGLTTIVSDIVKMPSFVSFAKLKASYAEVGSDTSPFQLDRTASIAAGGYNGFLTLSGTLPNENLKPERTKGLELGADVRFFNGRFGVDFTYYKTNTYNQLFSISLPPASGASSFFTNGGDVQNKGLELVVTGNPISSQNGLNWDISVNFSRNVGTVKKIHDTRSAIILQAGDLREIRVEAGKRWGEMYVRGFARDPQGKIIVENSGQPRYTAGKTVYAGNSEPDWLGGVQNSLSYKRFNFSFLIDVRQGGEIVSYTNSQLAAAGLTKETAAGREGTLVFGKDFYTTDGAVRADGTPNTLPINVQGFWESTGGRSAGLVGEIHTSSASNARLRELTLGYSFPKKTIGVPVYLGLTGRNVFFLYNKAQYIDPDMVVGTGAASQGDSSFGPPTTRSLGINVRVDF